MKKNTKSETWKDLLDKDDMLVRHIVPVENCDLVVYHRPGTRQEHKHHVVFYHGACGRSQMWQNQYHSFSEFDLYFVNVRGQGESPMKKGLPDLKGATQDVREILDYFGINKATLVGHSWGGNPLQEYTYIEPERVDALVLIGSWGQHRIMPEKQKKALKYSTLMYKIVPWSLVGKMNSKACSDNPRTISLVRKSILEAGRDVFISLGLSGFKAVHPIDGYKGNPPMLFIRGSMDFPEQLSEIYSYLEQTNPNARQVIIPGTKHQPMNDTPEEFNRILEDFLYEVDEKKKPDTGYERVLR